MQSGGKTSITAPISLKILRIFSFTPKSTAAIFFCDLSFFSPIINFEFVATFFIRFLSDIEPKSLICIIASLSVIFSDGYITPTLQPSSLIFFVKNLVSIFEIHIVLFNLR